ncbi:MAG: hypothetical protein JRH18_17835 [Deltaproteobacteria bacterium]|nr:hypothetical protein [Deltaproteobacteria bacterium]MBW1996049.1 hypothetical protein [Deltaproteobacteria bacterium]MBW2153519.1 hypothetical protein [Deltaproteobacteria bacterium]
MGIDYSAIKKILKASEGENLLEVALEKIQADSSHMTKEEAVIRLLMDLPKTG